MNQNKRKQRYVNLERQVARLEQRLTHLHEYNRRFVSARLIEFLLGITAAFIVLFTIGLEASLLVFGVTFVAFGILVWLHQRTQRTIAQFEGWVAIRRTHLARMRLDWAQISPRPWTNAAPRTPLETDFDLLGDRSLHHLLDTAVTLGGSQRLRAWLNPDRPHLETIHQRQAILQELQPAHTLRDKLTLTARLAAAQEAQSEETIWDTQPLSDWLTKTDAPDPQLRPWVWLLSIVALLNLTLLGLNLAGFIGAWWYGSFTVYILLSFFKASNIRQDVFSESAALADGLRPLTAVFKLLETHSYRHQPHLHHLCQPFLKTETRPSRRLQQVTRIVNGTGLRRNPFLWMLLNAAVPWDYFFVYQLQQLRHKLVDELPVWLEAWFEVEALCSLATFAYLHPDYVLPEVKQRGKGVPLIHGRGLGHPLIPFAERVCNDFALDTPPQVILITGSNMAGKSSFLRTVGLNLVLAYAGSVVPAQSLTTQPLRLFSAIKITDSVSDGISYFYAEVKRLKSLLDALRQEDDLPLFFFIDEIFRGTNNRERLIGSRAYIRALVGENGAGLVSTHDLELVHLADETPYIHNHHFRETVEEGRMVFDYTLRPGPCPTTNALRIMALEGLPVADVVNDISVG